MDERALHLQMEIHRHLIELASIADDKNKRLHVEIETQRVAKVNLVTLVNVEFEDQEMGLKLYTNTELPESDYHGEQFKDYLSGSELWGYYDACPAEVVYGEKKESASFLTGSATHSEVLEMHSFDDLYYRGYESPENVIRTQSGVKAKLKELGIKAETKGHFWAWCCALLKADSSLIIEEVEDLLVDYANQGKTKLKPEQYDNAKLMRKQLMQYPTYSEFVINGMCEHSIVGEIEINGEMVKVKTRPDIIYNNSIANYKTAADVKPGKLVRDCYNFGYFAKEYFNAIVYEALTGVFPGIYILAQSKKKPFVCTGIKMTDEMIEIGKSQFEQAFALWKACKDANQYIDYAQNEWLEPEVPAYMLTGL